MFRVTFSESKVCLPNNKSDKLDFYPHSHLKYFGVRAKSGFHVILQNLHTVDIRFKFEKKKKTVIIWLYKTHPASPKDSNLWKRRTHQLIDKKT